MVGVAQLVEHLVVVQESRVQVPSLTRPAPPPGRIGTPASVPIAPSGRAQDERR